MSHVTPQKTVSLADALAREQLVLIVLRSTAVFTSILIPVLYFVQGSLRTPQGLWFSVFVLTTLNAFAWLPRIPYRVRIGFLLLFLFVVAFLDLTRSGLIGTGRILLLAAVIISVTFLSRRISFILFGCSLLLIAIMGVLLATERITPLPRQQARFINPDEWLPVAFSYVAGLLVMGFVVWRIVRNATLAVRQQRELSSRLADERSYLTRRVDERTRALLVATEVGRILTTIEDASQLINLLVSQVQARFGYYYVHVYLLDPESDHLRMAGGTGEAGMALRLGRHQVLLGQGLVGRAAVTGQPILVPDVSSEPNWLPNRLLPDTRSELAVPIISGDTVIGVLDVQQSIVNGLAESDLQLMQILGNQVGVALRNANMFAHARASVEKERIINDMRVKIQATDSVDTLLKLVSRELGSALGAREARIAVDRIPTRSAQSAPAGDLKAGAVAG